MERVTDFAEYTRLSDELEATAIRRQLRLDQLGRAVEQVYYCPDAQTPPRSVGMNWIWRNCRLFAGLFTANEVEPLDFFRRHQDNFCVRTVIYHEELLRLIPEEERQAFIGRMFGRHITAGDSSSWLDVALCVGISREALAQLVLWKLRRAAVQAMRLPDECFLRHAFLKYGAGEIEERPAGSGKLYFKNEGSATYWSILTDEQLMEALRLASPEDLLAGCAPGERWTVVDKLQVRLTAKRQLTDVLNNAAQRLSFVDSAAMPTLSQLSLKARLTLLNRLQGDLDLLVGLALEEGEKNYDWAEQLCRRYQSLFYTGDPVANYQRLWPWLEANKSSLIASNIRLRLLSALSKEGYLEGQVQVGSYRNPRTQATKHQFQVKVAEGDRTVTYVRDRSDHSVLKKGDWVLFRPSDGKVLTPAVTAVVFIPREPRDPRTK